MMKRLLLYAATLAALLVLPATVNAGDWYDNFDAYAPGSQMHGQGGWTGWDNSPGAGALVSNLYSYSPANSVEIVAGTDLVHQYTGATSGKWIYTAYQYIPSGYAGLTYFILLQNYDSPLHTNTRWSVQMTFDSTDGMVHIDCGSTTQVIGPAFLLDQWVPITVNVDLDNDWCQVYYNGTLLDDPALADHPLLGGGYAWTKGVFGQYTTGTKTITTVDLFANSATPVYYDNLSLLRAKGWGDNIESYTAGVGIHTQPGGWEPWDNVPLAGAQVTNAQAHSGVNSIDIKGGSDLVYQYEGYTSGKCTYSAWQYIPTGFAGQSYFLLLNTYDHSGPYDWSVQVDFNAANGMVNGNFGAGTNIPITPYLLDQWVNITAVGRIVYKFVRLGL
jgi:hypothetical protein